ncbi:unnamed protein product [Urochloa decumbens]|uniref:Uncharacterized protein n=1 Tax=Urochloa decumbens TaxID=240449 RepID=A0ABC9FP12_9POAL
MAGGGVHGARDGGEQPRERRRRVLVFPLPFQGHIDPMMHLAGVLHDRGGLAITVLHTCFNALDPARHSEFRFVPVPDGMPADVAAAGRIIDVILAMNAAMEASPAAVRDALASALAEDGEDNGAACLVIDANLLAVQRVAREIGLITVVLRTGSAACLRCFLAYPMLHEKGYLPSQESQLYMPVPELPPLRVRDLFQTKISSHEMLCKVIARINETLRNSSGVVTNTFEALEPAELEKLRGELNLPFLLAAGPLHKLSSKKTTGSSLLDQDYGCIEWLDTQASGSVLYVSFGSLAAMDSGEFMEVAWGLANSGHPFLWVVRPKLVQDCDSVALPEGFEDVIKGRGMVIQWAPQQEVLAHRAVGGFWTHSGWNSTLESVSEGVPMICRLNAVDQMMNARYVENVWGVGFELEGELERGKIENAVRRLMDEREGAEIRERAKVLRRKVAECLDSSGSSQIAVDKFVSYILSL